MSPLMFIIAICLTAVIAFYGLAIYVKYVAEWRTRRRLDKLTDRLENWIDSKPEIK